MLVAMCMCVTFNMKLFHAFLLFLTTHRHPLTWSSRGKSFKLNNANNRYIYNNNNNNAKVNIEVRNAPKSELAENKDTAGVEPIFFFKERLKALQ